jgi:hypothetical protein
LSHFILIYYLFFGDVKTPPIEVQPFVSVGYPNPYATAEDEPAFVALFIIALDAEASNACCIVGAVSNDDVALPSITDLTIIFDTVPSVLYNSIFLLFFVFKYNLTGINIKMFRKPLL